MSGHVIDDAGRAVAGATVIVSVEPSNAESFATGTAALASLGLSCLTGCTPDHATGYSARDGSFAVAVPRDNPNHDAYSVTVAVARGPARVATSVNLPRSTRHGWRVGGIIVAHDNATVHDQGSREAIAPPALPDSVNATEFRAFLNTETGSPPVIDGSQTDITAGYDPRLLEDEHLLLTTAQTGRLHGRAAIFSSSLEVRGHVVPASRGAGCAIAGSHGQRIVQHRCGLTDGVLDAAWSPRDDPRCVAGPCRGPVGRHSRQATVRLRHPVAAGLVVVRGCDQCTIATSSDGHHFTSYGPEPASADDIVSKSLGGTRVAAVRITTDTGGFFDSLREVSVFGRRT